MASQARRLLRRARAQPEGCPFSARLARACRDLAEHRREYLAAFGWGGLGWIERRLYLLSV